MWAAAQRLLQIPPTELETELVIDSNLNDFRGLELAALPKIVCTPTGDSDQEADHVSAIADLRIEGFGGRKQHKEHPE